VDTGACRTLLNETVYRNICEANHRRPIVKLTSYGLKSVSGHEIKVVGVAEVQIKHAGIMNVVIVRNIPHDLILGNDTLRLGLGVIDLMGNVLKWFGSEWPIIPASGSELASLTVDTTISTGHDELDSIIQEYAEVFSVLPPSGKRDQLPAIPIETTGPPIAQRAYRTPLTKRKIIEEEIDKMLEEGVIRPSSSPWASPVTLVPKAGGAVRFCVDFRRVNDVTKKDRYPLPVIQDIFDQLGGANVYSLVDLRAGFWQLPLRESDIPKSAFRCHRGHYEFTKLPFGLANAPAAFQRTMDFVLSDLIGKSVLVYIDDIVIYSPDVRTHAQHLREVFERLDKYGLRLKASKCSFAQREIKLLGHVISSDGIATDPDKTDAIAKLRPPRNVSEVRSFLGMGNYYRSCIPNYAMVSEPLVRLTRKSESFVWGNEQRLAFEQLKQLLTSSHVMAYPMVNEPYKLYTDACNYAVGAILVQEHDGVEKVVQYVSHQLSGPQLRWATIEKEAYAVVYAIQKLRPYLYGAEVTVFTDHKPLTSLFTKEMINTKIQRWAVLLAEYGAKIRYRKGKNNIRADMLSRIKSFDVATIDTEWVDPDAYPDDDADMRLPILADGLDLDSLRGEQANEFLDLLQEADTEGSSYTILNGILYSIARPSITAPEYPRLVLPISHRTTVIGRAHREVGHSGSLKTLARVRESYVWPGMRRDIKSFLAKCAICRVNHDRRQHVPMGDMPLPVSPMQVIGMDLIGPMAVTEKGNRYALTIIDHHSGWAEVYPLPDKTNQSVWDAFSNRFLPTHGVPEIIITDNGKEFIAYAWEEYLRTIGVDHRRTTARRPECNGKSERLNRTFKSLLTKLVNNHATAWEDHVADALSAYRNSVSSVTGYTPFFLLYGRRARLPLTKLLSARGSGSPFGNRLDHLAEAFQIARVNTEESRVANRARLAAKANTADVSVGDSVVVKAEERLTLTSRHDPQYEVYRVRGPVCWVRHQRTGKTRVLNRVKLTIVDPNIQWDSVRERPRRNPWRSVVPNFQDDPRPMLKTAGRLNDDRRTDLELNRPAPAKVELPKINECRAPKRRRSERIANRNQYSVDQSTSSDQPMETEPSNMPEQNEDIEVDPVVPAFRKRHATGGPSCQEQKRARCEAIAAVALLCV
jgi:transposase InsO family protein